jgi:hypothetical protein
MAHKDRAVFLIMSDTTSKLLPCVTPRDARSAVQIEAYTIDRRPGGGLGGNGDRQPTTHAGAGLGLIGRIE